jgi:AcrR family transcriptional regulator
MSEATSTSEANVTITPGVREQIVEAADAHFSQYGYAKTTVADLAKAIGFSKAYIYKFFDSKQAIGEAICSRCLAGQLEKIKSAVDSASGAHNRLRSFFRAIVDQHRDQFFSDRQLYDIVAHSCAENWSSSASYIVELDALLTSVIRAGRETGEFERKTSLGEVSRAIWLAVSPFVNPVSLQHHLDEVDLGLPAVTGLVLRSLSP